MNRFLTLLALVAAFALIAAGCGGDDGGAGSGGSLTMAEFVKQGNEVCTAGKNEAKAEFEKFAEEHGLSARKPPTGAQLEEAAERFVIPAIGRQVEGVRALGAPDEEAEAVDTFLDNAEAEVEKVEADPSRLDEEAFDEVNKEARELGLTACGEG